MGLRTIPYRNEHLAQCVELMSDTWNFNRYFSGLKRRNLVNELFFRFSTVGNNYSEVVVDDSERVHGYIFGEVAPTRCDRVRAGLRTIALNFRALGNFIVGDLGPRRAARRRGAELLALSNALDANRRAGDAYVSLFFVGSSLRGLGWGKRLMESFRTVAARNGCDRLYLWTDKGCNYGFYDYTGFDRLKAVSSPLLAEYGSGENGFVYVKPVNGVGDTDST